MNNANCHLAQLTRVQMDAVSSKQTCMASQTLGRSLWRVDSGHGIDSRVQPLDPQHQNCRNKQ